MATAAGYVVPFRELTISDVPTVGGKNASLGEMIRELAPLGVRVPDGFAVTADALRLHLKEAGLTEWVSANLSAWTWPTRERRRRQPIASASASLMRRCRGRSASR